MIPIAKHMPQIVLYSHFWLSRAKLDGNRQEVRNHIMHMNYSYCSWFNNQMLVILVIWVAALGHPQDREEENRQRQRELLFFNKYKLFWTYTEKSSLYKWSQKKAKLLSSVYHYSDQIWNQHTQICEAKCLQLYTVSVLHINSCTNLLHFINYIEVLIQACIQHFTNKTFIGHFTTNLYIVSSWEYSLLSFIYNDYSLF